MKEKVWAVHVNLNSVKCSDWNSEVVFDDSVWETVVLECEKAGLNTIVLELGCGIEYGSHPELANKGAWTRQRVIGEAKRCREKGIEIVPLLNFSASHQAWLKEYGRMMCTPPYYKVCRDLIHEVYELFGKPSYINVGMDEEDADHQINRDFASYRSGKLLLHDLRFLLDCVRETGATPWIWSDCLFNDSEEFYKEIGAEDLVLSPWNYNALREEHYTPITSRPEYQTYYNEGKYAEMGLKYVEEDPFLVRFREQAIPNAKKGFAYIPCASSVNQCKYNTDELVEYFKEKAPECVTGFITAPWVKTVKEKEETIIKEIKMLAEARDKYYR